MQNYPFDQWGQTGEVPKLGENFFFLFLSFSFFCVKDGKNLSLPLMVLSSDFPEPVKILLWQTIGKGSVGVVARLRMYRLPWNLLWACVQSEETLLQGDWRSSLETE